VADAVDIARRVERWFEDQGFRLVTRGTPDGVVVDLVGDVNPSEVTENYAAARDTVSAMLIAEPRWLAEEETPRGVGLASKLSPARDANRKSWIDL
jgi:hypothetical protein